MELLIPDKATVCQGLCLVILQTNSSIQKQRVEYAILQLCHRGGNCVTDGTSALKVDQLSRESPALTFPVFLGHLTCLTLCLSHSARLYQKAPDFGLSLFNTQTDFLHKQIFTKIWYSPKRLR